MMLEIAIKNLMDNACKFSDNNSAQVYISFDPEWVKITVVDQGPALTSMTWNIFSIRFTAVKVPARSAVLV